MFKNSLSASAAGIAVILVLYGAGWMMTSPGGSDLTTATILFLLSLASCVSVAAEDPVIHGAGYGFGMVFMATIIGAGLGSGVEVLCLSVALGVLFPLAMAVTYWFRRGRNRGGRTYHVKFSHFR
ncbi:MAG: hypothetical protein WCF77_04500 [Minisyncoccia bacterium]